MGVRRIQSLLSALVIVGGLALTACDKTGKSSPPGGPTLAGDPAASGPSAGVESGVAPPAGDVTTASPGEPAPPPCHPDLDIQPTSFFAHRFLITLPKGIELVEQNPFFARSATATQTDSCGIGIPLAAVGYVRSSASLADIRQHVMLLRGFEDVKYSADSSQGGTTIATYDVLAGETPLRGLVFFKQDAGWYYWGLFEATPETFGSLERIYRASIASLLIRSVRGG